MRFDDRVLVLSLGKKKTLLILFVILSAVSDMQVSLFDTFFSETLVHQLRLSIG